MLDQDHFTNDKVMAESVSSEGEKGIRLNVRIVIPKTVSPLTSEPGSPDSGQCMP